MSLRLPWPRRYPLRRRPDGVLEREILAVLWAADDALLPAQIRDRIPSELAYTSVATVLGRLRKKGLVKRARAGRAFAYRPAVSEAELAVRRMSEVLDGATDRGTVLAGFVGSLNDKEAKALRSLLEKDSG